jgi:hypothetical protein
MGEVSYSGYYQYGIASGAVSGAVNGDVLRLSLPGMGEFELTAGEDEIAGQGGAGVTCPCLVRLHRLGGTTPSPRDALRSPCRAS